MSDFFNSSKYWAGHTNAIMAAWFLQLADYWWPLPYTDVGLAIGYAFAFSWSLVMFYRSDKRERAYEAALMERASKNIERIERMKNGAP